MSSTVIASALQNDLNSFVASAGVILFYLVVWGLVFAGTGLFVGAFIPFITGDTLLTFVNDLRQSTDEATTQLNDALAHTTSLALELQKEKKDEQQIIIHDC